MNRLFNEYEIGNFLVNVFGERRGSSPLPAAGETLFRNGRRGIRSPEAARRTIT